MSKLRNVLNREARYRAKIRKLQATLQQYGDVAGLNPIKYPQGRRLPDPDLEQDPAFLAFELECLTTTIEGLRETGLLAQNRGGGESSPIMDFLSWWTRWRHLTIRSLPPKYGDELDALVRRLREAHGQEKAEEGPAHWGTPDP